LGASSHPLSSSQSLSSCTPEKECEQDPGPLGDWPSRQHPSTALPDAEAERDQACPGSSHGIHRAGRAALVEGIAAGCAGSVGCPSCAPYPWGLGFRDFEQFRAIILSEMKNEREFDLLTAPTKMIAATGQRLRMWCSADTQKRHRVVFGG